MTCGQMMEVTRLLVLVGAGSKAVASRRQGDCQCDSDSDNELGLLGWSPRSSCAARTPGSTNRLHSVGPASESAWVPTRSPSWTGPQLEWDGFKMETLEPGRPGDGLWTTGKMPVGRYIGIMFGFSKLICCVPNLTPKTSRHRVGARHIFSTNQQQTFCWQQKKKMEMHYDHHMSKYLLLKFMRKAAGVAAGLQFMHIAAYPSFPRFHFDSHKDHDDYFNFVESMWYGLVGVGIGELRKGENELSKKK
jgi:hypothetical protein